MDLDCDNIDTLPVDNSYISDQDKYLLSTLFPVKEGVSERSEPLRVREGLLGY